MSRIALSLTFGLLFASCSEESEGASSNEADSSDSSASASVGTGEDSAGTDVTTGPDPSDTSGASGTTDASASMDGSDATDASDTSEVPTGTDTEGGCEPPGDDCGDCMAMNCCEEILECQADVDCACFTNCAAENPDDAIACAGSDACDIPLPSLLDPSTVVGRMSVCTQMNCAQCL